MNHRWWIAVILILSAFFPTGCLSTGKMVPEVTRVSTPRFDASILVGDVTGAQKETFGGPAQIQNKQFRETLAQTLQASGLFRSVVSEGAASYRIRAELVAQGQSAGMDYEQALVVDYVVTDATTKQIVWRQGFNSRQMVTFAEEFSGAARTLKAQEGCVRKNLKQFIEALAQAELKPSSKN